MKREIYTKTVVFDDGTISVVDATTEISRLRKELSFKNQNETMTVEEVADLFRMKKSTIQSKLCRGDFLEDTHYKRLSKRKVLFYRKPLLKMLGIE
ncbi:hypothetical protein [Seleniivibrio woodruffii]|uniref:hypothetical protein n=1 Tax=Seleniivibrio woodruffii TaxID=1078050 RepID=UPI0024097FD4|nr:hypothetical protein [Seleniivibrio woodruffii]